MEFSGGPGLTTWANGTTITFTHILKDEIDGQIPKANHTLAQ